MKFLCVSCDEQMSLDRTRGPEEGSMTVIFGCPKCGNEIAMMTNPMETQMVRALDVKIGKPDSVQPEPMSFIRNTLSGIGSIPSGEPPAHASYSAGQEVDEEGPRASKCPFSGAIAEAMEASAKGIAWTEGARTRIEKIPPFVREMAEKGVVDYAIEQGYDTITESVLDEVRGNFGF